MATQPRNRLLTFNDPHPMRIDRDLAAEIGLNESILLLQIEYLISISSNEREGRLWTYQSLTNLRETYFPWWSMMTISRTLRSLEEKRLLLIGNFNKLGYDRTQWFALNEEGINLLHSVAIYQNDKSIYQNDMIDPNKMLNGSYQNVTTIPESTQRVPESVGSDASEAPARKRVPRTPPIPKQTNIDSFNEAIIIFKELSGKKQLTPALITLIVTRVSDMQKWRATIESWAGCGYNVMNVKDILDWYDHPEKMTARMGRNSQRPSYSNGTRAAADLDLVQADLSAIPTPEERAAAAERRKVILEQSRVANK